MERHYTIGEAKDILQLTRQGVHARIKARIKSQELNDSDYYYSGREVILRPSGLDKLKK